MKGLLNYKPETLARLPILLYITKDLRKDQNASSTESQEYSTLSFPCSLKCKLKFHAYRLLLWVFPATFFQSTGWSLSDLSRIAQRVEPQGPPVRYYVAAGT